MLTPRTVVKALPAIIGLTGTMLFATLPSTACYSGLTAIPTADVVAAGHYSGSLQIVGSIPDEEINGKFLNTEFGVTDRLEAGVDLDLESGADTLLYGNAKYVVARTPKRAFAAGIYNLAEGVQAVPYLVGTQNFGPLRGHLGASRIEGNIRGFVGVDHAVNDKLLVAVDYTNGDENYLAFGANYQFTQRVGVYAGIQVPNNGDGTLGTLYLTYCGSFTK